MTAAEPLRDVKIVVPKRIGDSRGFFSETWRRDRFAECGVDADFVQDNHSLSAKAHTLRGLHFQTEPFAQAKLVRVVKGSILDVAVDLRHGSPTFGRHAAIVVSAAAGNQLYVPTGFAHGFLTLEPDTEVLYKVSAYYSPAHDKGLLWSDPALGIDWGVPEDEAVVSDKDRLHPRLQDLPRYFAYRSASRPEQEGE